MGGNHVNCSLNHVPMLGLLGMVTHQAMNTAKLMYQEFDLNRSQADILFTMYHRQSLSQKELAGLLNVTAPSITSSIQKMERAGYIRRQTDPSDQRVMRLALTEKGNACIETVKDVTDRMEKIIFEDMSPEEKMMFRRLLIQTSGNLEKYERKNSL